MIGKHSGVSSAIASCLTTILLLAMIYWQPSVLGMPSLVLAQSDTSSNRGGGNNGDGNKGASNKASYPSGEDCCTAQATARIAGAAGFIEIAGIKLGSSAEEVVAAFKAYKIQI